MSTNDALKLVVCAFGAGVNLAFVIALESRLAKAIAAFGLLWAVVVGYGIAV